MPGTAYRETLWPRIWVWLLPLGFSGSLGIAYGYAYGPVAGWAVGVASTALLLLAMVLLGRTVVAVDDRAVQAGRARLPLEHVGRVRALDARQTQLARTRDADAAAFLLLRTWASSRSVVLEVTDPDDPHPYWLISTRRPQELAQALLSARDAAAAG